MGDAAGLPTFEQDVRPRGVTQLVPRAEPLAGTREVRSVLRRRDGDGFRREVRLGVGELGVPERQVPALADRLWDGMVALA